MHLSFRIKQIAAVAACMVSVLAFGQTPETKPDKVKIHEIESVGISITGAAMVKVTAVGDVPTSGWTGGQLVGSANHKDGSGDGNVITMHYDFVAVKPTGVVSQVITKITAETSLPAPPAGKLLKVVVRSETNEKEGSIDSPHQRP
jgi:hypothetical protein